MRKEGGTPLRYGIHESALKKWAGQHLTCEPGPEGALHFIFHYEGSTCTNGGTPIHAQMHAIVREEPRGPIFETGWIAIDENDRGLARMCGTKYGGRAFTARLGQPPAFSGRPIEQILDLFEAINPAGCFCDEAMIQHKWRQALSTILYALSQGVDAMHRG